MSTPQPISPANPCIVEKRKKFARSAIEEVFNSQENFQLSHVNFSNDDHQDKIPNAIVTIAMINQPSQTFTVHIPLIDLGDLPYWVEGEMTQECREALERHAKKAIPKFRQAQVLDARTEQSRALGHLP